MTTNSIYNNLIAQVNKLYRHNRQGSFRTKKRYYEAMQRFCHFLAETYHLERLANIAPKHIYAYKSHMQEKELAVSTIKTDLAAIRFFHDQIPNARHTLPSNQDLGIAQRRFGRIDRTWSIREFNLFVSKAVELGREDYVTVFCLARYAALRLHECFRMDTQTAAKAVKTGIITIKGKGGLVRDVPINLSIEIQLKKMLEVTPLGCKLFVEPADKTHLAMRRFENFIHYHRADLQDADSTRPMSFHGLRHTCAAEWYTKYISEGHNEKEARRRVSQLLGHHRDEVTKIYLASLRNRGGHSDC